MSSSSVERRVWAIVPAAGRGARFTPQDSNPSQDGSAEPHRPKQYAPLRGATVLEWSLRALLAEPRIHGIVVVLAPGDNHWAGVADRVLNSKLHTTFGGENRQDSVRNGLDYLASMATQDDWILVHDAARPCLLAADVSALLAALERIDTVDLRGAVDERGAVDARGALDARDNVGADDRKRPAGAVLAAPIVDTVKREGRGRVETVERQGLWRALTPQAFPYARLRQALEDASSNGVAVTDEAQAMERLGYSSILVQGSAFNVKLTRAEDLAVAERLLNMSEATAMRVGQGFDVHCFGEGDHVMLGGVRIDHAKGVVAHSDGDVVIHALCDAILGALGEGDIGQHFPDSDPRYRGADSRVFLREVAARMRAAGLQLVNADVTVLAEAPRIAAHRAAMSEKLSADLGISARLINIKATTTERLGFVGRGEGLAALASVLLSS